MHAWSGNRKFLTGICCDASSSQSQIVWRTGIVCQVRRASTLLSVARLDYSLSSLQEVSSISRQLGGPFLRECFAYDAFQARAEATLAYEEVIARGPDQGQNDQLNNGVIVHGLLGTGRNWRTFARLLAKQAASESGR